MKPHQPKKIAEGVSRARMFIQRDLAWMTGFPDGEGGWVSMPARQAPQRMSIRREDLRRATFTLNKLIREFPRALPKVVGDVEHWAHLHRSLLAQFSALVHQDEPLADHAGHVHTAYRASTRSQLTYLLARSRALRSCANAFSWYCWLHPKALPPALKWVETHGAHIDNIIDRLGAVDGCRLIIHLHQLAQDHGDGRIAALLDVLGNFQPDAPHRGGRKYIHEVRKGLKECPQRLNVARPRDSTLYQRTCEWIRWLAEQPDKIARNGLALYDALHSSFALDRWRAWWKDVDALASCLGHASIKEQRQLIRELRALAEAVPADLDVQQFFACLRRQAQRLERDQLNVTVSTLRLLPCQHQDAPLRAVFFAHWQHQTPSSAYMQLRSEFAQYLEHHPDITAAIHPWSALWTRERLTRIWRYGHYTLDEELLRDLPTRDRLREYFRALTRFAATRPEPVEEEDAEALLWLYAALDDGQRAVDAWRRLGEARDRYTREALQLAARLSPHDMATVATVARALQQAMQRTHDVTSCITELLACWPSQLRGLLADAISDGHLPSLLRIAQRRKLLHCLGDSATQTPPTPQTPEELPDWCARYPAPLHQRLQQLHAWDGDAQETAARILHRDLPDPRTLHEELHALEQRVRRAPSDALCKRMANLRRRIETPRAPSPARLDTLAAKLRTATTRAMVQRWERATEATCTLALQKLLGTQALPSWADGQTLGERLGGIDRLGPAFHQLVIDLLRVRSGPPPWDLRERPGNTAFLQRMAARGVHLQPWLDEAPVLERELAGERVRFTLERDPLEVFAMGAHFGTCLSPGDLNHFSVFANAADVNKQVLYGRRPNGVVAARCLLALSDQGELVAFHPYSHREPAAFREATAAYVALLATSMATTSAPDARISRLVAPDWYDDGPVDLGDSLAFLRSDEGARVLATIPLDELLPWLRQQSGRQALHPALVDRFCSLQAVEARPELVVPLVPVLAAQSDPSHWHLVRVVQRLGACAELDLARPFVTPLVRATLIAFRRHGEWAGTAALAIAPVAPSEALRLLKATRLHDVRKWDDEWDSERLLAAATAQVGLARPQQARRLLEQALSQGAYEPIRTQCEALLRSLTA